MPNPLPTGQGTHVFSGARAVFHFNGDLVAWANGCSASEEIQYEAIDVLNNLAVAEHVPVGYRVTFTASIFRTVGFGNVSTTDAPGSLKEQNIFPHFADILRLQGVDCSIIDSISGKTIMKLTSVKTASSQISVTPRGVSGQNVTFVAILMKDESEIKGAVPLAA